MKRVLLLIALSLPVLASLAPTAAAQTPPTAKYQMEMYHVVLVKHGPNWKPQGSEEGMDIRMNVIENIRKGVKEGLVVTAGLVNDETDVEFIIILHVETKTEALEIAKKAPNIRNGMYTPEIYSWFAPKGMTVDPPRPAAPR
jgi:hypothetical protein